MRLPARTLPLVPLCSLFLVLFLFSGSLASGHSAPRRAPRPARNQNGLTLIPGTSNKIGYRKITQTWAATLHGRQLAPRLPRKPAARPRVAPQVADDVPGFPVNVEFEGPDSDTPDTIQPPNCAMATGLDNVVVAIQNVIGAYDKSGDLVGDFQTLDDTDFWSGFGIPGAYLFPRLVYDQRHGRYILSMLVDNFSPDLSFILVAISQTEDPTGEWDKYALNILSQDANGNTTFGDLTNLGLTATAVYLSTGMFDDQGVFSDTRLYVIPLAPLLAGDPSIPVTIFTDVMNVDFNPNNPAFSIQPAIRYGEDGTEFLVAVQSQNKLSLFTIYDFEGSPVLAVKDILIPQWDFLPPSPYGDITVDLIDERITSSAVCRGNSLWCAHTIGESGFAVSRWYEIDVTTFLSATLKQAGNVGGPEPVGTGFDCLFPSISVSEGNNAVMTFTATALGESGSSAYAARADDDPPGTMREVGIYHQGSGDYDANRLTPPPNGSFWGLYMTAAADPDGASIWLFSEFVNGTDAWGTSVAQVETPVVEPLVADAGPDQEVNELDFVVLDGSGSFDPNGGTLDFHWEQIGGPDVDLADADTEFPSFEAPLVADRALLTFKLTVTASGESASDTTQVFVDPAPDATAAGLITDQDGNPVGGAHVVAVREDGQQSTEVVSLEDGSYFIPDVRAGFNTVFATFPGLDPGSVDAFFEPGDNLILDIQLGPAAATLSGQARYSNGQPIPNGTVEVLDGTGQVLGAANTDFQGHYQITGLTTEQVDSATVVQLRENAAGPQDFPTWTLDAALEPDTDNTQDFTFASLKVKVVSSGKKAKPVAGASVGVLVGSQLVGGGFTNTKGAISFVNVPAELVRILVSKGSARAGEVQKDLSPGAQATVTVKLPAAPR